MPSAHQVIARRLTRRIRRAGGVGRGLGEGRRVERQVAKDFVGGNVMKTESLARALLPLVGLVGCFQAVEAFKLLSGAGRAHQGLATFDGLSGQWRHFQVPRDPACPACGNR